MLESSIFTRLPTFHFCIASRTWLIKGEDARQFQPASCARSETYQQNDFFILWEAAEHGGHVAKPVHTCNFPNRCIVVRHLVERNTRLALTSDLRHEHSESHLYPL